MTIKVSQLIEALQKLPQDARSSQRIEINFEQHLQDFRIFESVHKDNCIEIQRSNHSYELIK